MQTTQGSMLQSLRAVDGFIDGNAAALAGVINTGARQKLTTAIVDLSTHTTEQAGNELAAQGATKHQQFLRQILMRDHMAPIARIARADLPQTPQIEPLRMPRGNPTTEKLAAAAKGMATAATPYAGVFIGAGLATDFIPQLNTAADALLASFDDGAQSRGKRRGNTNGLKERLSAGRKIVHILDAFITIALKDDPALLANWSSVKRVRRIGVRPASPSPVAPAPVASTPAAPAPAAAPTSTPTTA